MQQIKQCHWCGEKLLGLVSDFVHCIRCNERRLVEGLTPTFDPCPICMTVKSRVEAMKPNFEMKRGERHG